MPKKRDGRRLPSDDSDGRSSPRPRLTGVGADPVIEEPTGAGDPAVLPGTVDEKRGDKGDPREQRERKYGLLGE